MVSGISTSVNLHERSVSKNNSTNQNIASIMADFLASDYNKDIRLFDSKEEMLNFCSIGGISTLESFTHMIGAIKGLDTKNINPESEFQEYMQSRGCSNSRELEILNTTPFKTKDEYYKFVKYDVEGKASSIEYSSGIDIPDSQIDAILKNSTMENIAKYRAIDTRTISESVAKFQTLLSDVFNQDNISPGLKKSLYSLSSNISGASAAINKWSDEVDAENARDKPMIDALKARLIAQYQS